MVLGFNENFEAFIEAQFPNDLSESYNLKASDLMNIYTLHRMEKNGPNFFQMEIREFTVASFFTGFSLKHYVGRPDYAITIFFSNEEMTQDSSLIDYDFEGKLRKIAYDILPKRGETNFTGLLEDYYGKLENQQIEPYWDEYNEDEISKFVPLPTEGSSDEITTEVNPINLAHMNNPQTNENDKEQNYYKLENEVLKTEIESLEMLLKEKTEKITELSQSQNMSEGPDTADWKSKYEKLEEYNQILTENVDKLTELNSKYDEEIKRFTNNKTELQKKMDSKETLINELTRKLEKTTKELEGCKESKDDAIEYYQVMELLKKENKELIQENQTLKKDNEIHLDSIADLKLKLRDFKEKASSEGNAQDNLTEELIDLKKEIKVLRRERDHYRAIIKEKNLL